MINIPINQQIGVYDYATLCDYQCITEDDLVDFPDSCIVYCPNDNIRNLFNYLYTNKLDQKYLIVSGASDFGLHYQDDFPVNPDLPKALSRVDFSDYYTVKDKYLPFALTPAAHLHQCKPSDKYSLRCYHYTHATFPEIPQQVKYWYSANLSINDDPRLECLPLGLLNKIENVDHAKKKNLLYINFSNITMERKWLKENWVPTLSGNWFTFKEKAEPSEYLQDMQEHWFILSPPGNGWDTYRTTETFILGSIPITKDTIWAGLQKIPMLLVNSYKMINEKMLLNALEELNGSTFNIDSLTLQYWNNQIQNKWKEINEVVNT